MPEPSVTVKLSLDTSQLQQDARKAGDAVKTALSGDGSKAPDSFDRLGRSAQEAGEHLRKHGEAAREAREKLEPLLKLFEHGKEQVTDFGKELKNAVIGFVGLAGAFEMVKRAMEQGAAAEATRVRFQNLVGTTQEASAAFTQLQGVARETTTPMREVAETAESMYASGQSVGQVTGQMENLAKIAKITGTPLSEIGELLERIRLHGDVTFRELFRLTQATGGATRELAEQYRDIPRELELIKTASEAANKIQQTAFEAAEKWHGAIEQVAKKGGLLDAVFKQWQTSFGRMATTGLAGAGFGPWGAKAGRELMESFNEGMKQVSSETGISLASVMRMVRAGLYTAEELLQKAKERREAIEHIAQASMEASRAMVEGAFQQRQIGILDQIGAALNRTGDIQEKFAATESTMEARLEQAGAAISREFTKVGLGINTQLLPALKEFAEGDWIGALGKLPPLLQIIAGGFAAIGTVIAGIKIVETIRAGGAALEWLAAKSGTAAAAEEGLAGAEASASAAAETQAAASGAAGAAKGTMAAEATTAAAAEGELAGAETAASAGAEKGAAAIGGLRAAGSGFLAMLTDEIDALGHFNDSQKQREENLYKSSNYWRKVFGMPELQVPEAEDPNKRPSPMRPPVAATGVPLAPTTAPIWDPSRWPNLQQQAITQTRGQLMAGVPAGLSDPKARDLVDKFATGIATMKNALEQHDMNAARQAAADIQREAGRVGLVSGLLPADQAQALNQAVSTLYRGLTSFIEAAGDLPKDMAPLVESLADAAESFSKAAEPSVGKGEFYPQVPPTEKPEATGPSRTQDQGEAGRAESQAEDVKGRIAAAYTKWFMSRGEAAKSAETELRAEMADAAAHGIQAFQHGGIVRRPTLAMIGEAGPEAVVPLNKVFGGNGGPYPQAKDVIPGIPGQTFQMLPYAGSANQQRIETDLRAQGGQMLVDLMKPGRHEDYREAVSRGLIPDVQAGAAAGLLRGGGAFGRLPGGGGAWGMLPPSGTMRPSAASNVTPARALAPSPSTSAPSFSGAHIGGGGGGGTFGGAGIVSTSDEAVVGRLDELLSIFRTA